MVFLFWDMYNSLLFLTQEILNIYFISKQKKYYNCTTTTTIATPGTDFSLLFPSMYQFPSQI